MDKKSVHCMPVCQRLSFAGKPCARNTAKKPLMAALSLLTLAILAAWVPVHAQVIIDGGATESVPGTQPNPWILGSGLVVGNSGTGTLNITNGGVVSATSNLTAVDIGTNSGSNGTVNVDGAGSILMVDGPFAIAREGAGTLNITNGGAVSSTANTIISLEGGNGTVSVDGSGSKWTASGYIIVGYTGMASMSITNGGAVSNVFGYIGNRANGTGTVTVDGAGSTWTNIGTLYVASQGTASLNITNGGAVSNAAGYIGNGSGSSGIVTVNGAGSRWTNSGILFIASSGTGTLTVSNGAVVSAALVSAGANGGTGVINIGAAQGGSAVAPGMLDTSTISLGTRGSLVFNHTGTGYAFTPQITDIGTVGHFAGTTVFSSANTYSGATAVNGGILRAGAANTFSPNSVMTVASAGTLDLNGFNQTLPGLTNAGLVSMGSGTSPGTILTVRGNYTGNGGTIALNTLLETDDSPSDRLMIDGGTASGNSLLRILNAGGAGALTTGNGILVVDTLNGGTTASNAFSLSGPVVAGPYEYTLYRSSIDGASTEGWYLRSTLDCALAPDLPECRQDAPEPPNYRIEDSMYAALPSMALLYGRNLIGTLHERVGEEEDIRGRSDLHQMTPGTGGWGRIIGSHGRQDGDADGIFGSGPKYRYDFAGLQAGHDLLRYQHADGSRDHAGAYFAYGHASGSVTHFDGETGSNKFDAYTLGAYWTHFGASGWYVDAVLQGTHYDARSTANRGLPALTASGNGIAMSLEGGKPFRYGNGYFIEPQAQLIYQFIHFSDASDTAAKVDFSRVDSLAGRIGARFGRNWQLDNDPGGRMLTAWIRPNIWHEFRGNPVTRVSSETGPIPFRADLQGTWGEINAGVSGQISRSTTLFANASFQQRFDGGGYDYGGKIGVRVNW